MDLLKQKLDSLDLSSASNKGLTKKVVPNKEVVKEILRALNQPVTKEILTVLNDDKTYSLQTIETNTTEYNEVYKFFDSTLGFNFIMEYITTVGIKRVVAPYLQASFHLKLAKKSKSDHVHVEKFYHGTESINIDPICKENFNWRLKGSSVGHIFGQGVYFAKKALCAICYPNPLIYDNPRTVIMAKILYTNEIEGNPNMVVPPNGYDCTRNSTEDISGDVFVKYDDSEYVPHYIIYYKNNYDFLFK